ncbi:MAG TPA: adenylate/guanylate cyclase domain-containing protein [Streptosporangiaceae bacterium]
MSVCPACGHRNQPGAKFYSECGAALVAAEPLAVEERKVVSVLFADLVGFTSRAEQMDPEDVRALLSPFYGRLRAELEWFGGTVEKFIGDAVMALFGAPVTHGRRGAGGARGAGDPGLGARGGEDPGPAGGEHRGGAGHDGRPAGPG